MPQENKTVYILGAGFSRPANYPLQSEIIPSLKKLSLMDFASPDVTSEMDASNAAMEFIETAFPGASPSLEDVFTLLDQAIHDEGFYSTNWRNLYDTRDSLKKAIWSLYKNKSGSNTKSDFYNYLAANLIKDRVSVGQSADPFSVISLNWDTLLEDSLYSCIEKAKGLRKIDIDYCCRTTPLSNRGPHTPSINQKSRGIYNIKLLKLHGSVNWLHCPNCGLLYTSVGDSTASKYTLASKLECNNCATRRYKGNTSGLPILEHFFITPTFLKVFENVHLKMIWHNAYHELSEASEVVFVGYSFPEADYHLRALLKRSLKPSVKISVVLKSGNADKKQRYCNFFGKKNIGFNLLGVENYFYRKYGKPRLKACVNKISHLLKHKKANH